jgi:hypothetical protein
MDFTVPAASPTSRVTTSTLLRWLSSQHRRHILVALPILLSVSVFYEFMASTGTFRDLEGQRHYASMADGFEHGHLYLQRRPRPELLKQEDPLHPSNKPLWIWDASLYKGHWYLYWGPVPALLSIAIDRLTGSGPLSDQTLTLIFMLGRLYAGAALILGLARSVRARQPPAWLVALAIAAFGLTSPIPFILARPYVYEACLAAGQCFLFCGLAFAFWGLVGSRWRTLKFVLASVCWGLAIGSRVTMAIPVPLIILGTAGVLWIYYERSVRELLKHVLALGIPATCAVVAYAAYNYARFDSVTEFGTTWQASTQRFVTNDIFVIPNIYSYLFAPVSWSCRFPFVMAVAHRPLATWIDWPKGYKTFELVGGLLLLSGWCWLLLLLLLRPLLATWQRWRHRGLASAGRVPAPELWALLCAGAILLSMLPVLGLWEASMRYTGDAVGGVVLAATLAAFWWKRRAEAGAKPGLVWGTRVALLMLGLHTCIVGAFSGISSYRDPFKLQNPALYDTLQRSWSLCGRES